jgi:hypothetical protein
VFIYQQTQLMQIELLELKLTDLYGATSAQTIATTNAFMQ